MSAIYENGPLKKIDRTEIKQQLNNFLQYPLLTKFIDSLPVPVMVLNSYRHVVYSNRSLNKIAGRSESQKVFGLLPGEVFNCVHSYETPNGCGTTEFCTTCGALRAYNSSGSKEDVQECRIIKKDNDALDLRVHSSPLKIGDDKFTVFAVCDISDEKRRKNLERIFFHDLLNTAISVKALVHSLENADKSEAEEFKAHLLRMSEKLVDEICAQRDIYAAENNELNIFLSRCNTIEVMDDIRDQFNHNTSDRRIVIDPRSDKFDFYTDKVLIRRILTNMMKNAVEATAENETIKMGCRQKNDFVQFSIHNPGYIERDVQLQIFQRSFTTKGYDRGIGTYSMKLLCENYLKGKISFESTKEEGTTFYCSIPVNLD